MLKSFPISKRNGSHLVKKRLFEKKIETIHFHQSTPHKRHLIPNHFEWHVMNTCTLTHLNLVLMFLVFSCVLKTHNRITKQPSCSLNVQVSSFDLCVHVFMSMIFFIVTMLGVSLVMHDKHYNKMCPCSLCDFIGFWVNPLVPIQWGQRIH